MLKKPKDLFMKNVFTIFLISIISLNVAANKRYNEIELYADLAIASDTKKIELLTNDTTNYINAKCTIEVDSSALDFEDGQVYVIPKGSRIKTIGTGTKISKSLVNAAHYTKFLLFFTGLLPYVKTGEKELAHKVLKKISCKYRAETGIGMEKAVPITDENVKEWMDRDISESFRLVPFDNRVVLE